VRDSDALIAPQQAVQLRLSRWRTYTLRFITRYGLNEEQRQKALQICGECESKGLRLIERMAEQVTELERTRDRILTTAIDGEVAPQTMQAYLKQRGALLDRLDSIFENELKPRLDRLLTRSQRAQGEKPKENEDVP
jgi:hypothetical protein